MTVSTTTNSQSYVGSGTSPFNFPYKFFANTDLVVSRLTADGAISTLVLDVDYSVSGAGDPAGGTVTPLASETGNTITVTRSLPRTQETDFSDLGPFPAENTETALDRLTMLIQEAIDVVQRSVVAPVGDAAATLTLPVASSRALKLLGFDGSGNINMFDTTTSYVNEGAWESIASAATTDITGAASRNKRISGTATITSLGTGTDGMQRFLSFAGACTITHNAAIDCPNGVSLVTAANDYAVLTWYLSRWRFTAYHRYTGQPVLPVALTSLASQEAGTMLARLPGSGAGSPVAATLTAAGYALLDDTDASAQRTTLGLGTAAVAATGTSSGNVPVLGTGGLLDATKLSVAGGTAVTRLLFGSLTFDFPSIAGGGLQTTTLTVTGAQVGDFCFVNKAAAGASSSLIPVARATSANTVTISMSNPTASAVDPGSDTYVVLVIGIT